MEIIWLMKTLPTRILIKADGLKRTLKKWVIRV
jgi:hypothetical protein